MPTTRPRYTFTDTGELRDMLDLAQQVWPDVDDRKELLYRLARLGEDAARRQAGEADAEARRGFQRAALERAEELVDVDLVLSDSAWR